MGTMLGCSVEAAASDSWTKRCRNASSLDRSGRNSLTTTLRRGDICSARYTVPMPPWPSTETIRYPATSDPIRTSLIGCCTPRSDPACVCRARGARIACASRERGRSSVVQAYILIQTEVGKAAQVAKEVRDIAGVAEAEDVTGPYDVIVRAEAKNVDELGKLVVARIQGVEGITRTLTCPVVHL